MNLNKTHGLDGLPVEFILLFGLIFLICFLISLNLSMKNGIMSNLQRNGVISLLQKRRRIE